MERGGGNEEYELELQVLRPLPVDQDDIQCFSLVGNYSQTGRPNFPPDDINRCILIDIPLNDQIPVHPGDVVGFYSNHVRDNDDDGVQLNVFRPDVTAFYRERTSIPAPTPSSCSLIAGPGNIDSTTTAAPVITVVVGKLLIQNVHQQGNTYALGALAPTLLPLCQHRCAVGVHSQLTSALFDMAVVPLCFSLLIF